MRFKERLFNLRQRKIGMTNTNRSSKIEILAPCGSYDILIAAIHAGADACYIGGNRFGARAYAQNFDEQAIIQAISYAHLHGVKIYLTVNTLFKQHEITQIYDYIRPYYEAGLDAVIVQDLGAFSLIRSCFPDLPIHCSTQMNITSVHGAVMMAKQGAKRVVTAREMTLDEIAAIKQQTDIEIETFVHGALCYSYSGQCLMSSLAGGRSGNRGRCAQPCRKCYDDSYILSMKDLCSLTHVPKLMEAGIDSLKIEGRMKNVAYVASAVHAYKTIAEDYQNNCYDEDKAKALSFDLANIYNRGGFTDGYFFRHNGRDMISVSRPNNQGVCIGTLIGTKAGKVQIRLSEDLYKQDVLELSCKNSEIIEITSGIAANKGELVTLNCPKTKLLKEGTSVYRTKCVHLIEQIESNYINEYKKQPLNMMLTAKIGEPLSLTVSTMIENTSYKTQVTGCVVEHSKQDNLSEDMIKKPLGQLGNTDYYAACITIDYSTDAFVPAGLLKKLRREAIEKLEEEIVDSKRRPAVKTVKIEDGMPTNEKLLHPNERNTDDTLFIRVSNLIQLEEVLKFHQNHEILINGIAIPYAVYSQLEENHKTSMIKQKITYFIELPHIVSKADTINQYLPNELIGGIYIRNIDGLAMFANSDFSTDYSTDLEIICDAGLYCYNQLAFYYIRSILGENRKIRFIMPRELTISELQELSDMPICMTLYEYQPVMLTANCSKKSTGHCDHADAIRKITDDKNNIFYEQAFCNRCYNVIYNGTPYNILDKYRESSFDHIHAAGYCMQFTIESAKEIEKVLSDYCRSLSNEQLIIGQKTNGHLYRGVL